ncbi:MAG: tetratricopeptide repeat protein [Spirochaetaceae bacterium]|jgi:tetratricopeptide (TPR) repeat protein|nr:tetratricopeptide repeat protein [Spirochaetaceae bacterium]
MAKNSEITGEEFAVKEEQIPPFAPKPDFNQPVSASERLNLFIQNNRRLIFAGALGLGVVFIGFIAGLIVFEALRNGALEQAEEFVQRYETLNLTDPAKESEVTAFIADLTVFAKNHAGYASARGYSLLGSIYMEKKDWESAEKAWTAGAKAGGKTYLTPVSLCNAAVSAEEQGNIQGAIDYYAQSIAFGETFPTASRAQFQIGRLEEERKDKDAALKAYREVINKWPDDPLWTNLAQSRIIALGL